MYIEKKIRSLETAFLKEMWQLIFVLFIKGPELFSKYNIVRLLTKKRFQVSFLQPQVAQT